MASASRASFDPAGDTRLRRSKQPGRRRYGPYALWAIGIRFGKLGTTGSRERPLLGLRLQYPKAPLDDAAVTVLASAEGLQQIERFTQEGALGEPQRARIAASPGGQRRKAARDARAAKLT